MTDFTVISQDALQEWLATCPRWAVQQDEIVAAYKFKNFVEAFGFMARVAVVAEKHNHHPRIENTYNKVTLSMTTHDADNKITTKDLKLAEEIESLT